MASQLLDFLASEEWDAPFFKRLARNDTAEARGHQAGMVLPKDLREFFPALDERRISARHPTIDRNIRVGMFTGVKQIATGVVRYQFQTWGGTRSPESRITDGFAPIHRRARGGDILLFQRSAEALDQFRFILIRQGTRAYTEVNRLVGDRPRGPLFAENPPVTQNQLVAAANELEQLAIQPFSLTVERTRVETRQSRVARSSVFPVLVGREYDWRCCVSGIEIQTPYRLHEVEAAHVVPVTEGGADDVRNGLSLSRTLHWAFDRGLFGIAPDRTVHVARRVMSGTANEFLKQFHGRSIDEARTDDLRAHADALDWHLRHRVRQWE
jgi:putative restriction endonuclease